MINSQAVVALLDNNLTPELQKEMEGAAQEYVAHEAEALVKVCVIFGR